MVVVASLAVAGVVLSVLAAAAAVPLNIAAWAAAQLGSLLGTLRVYRAAVIDDNLAVAHVDARAPAVTGHLLTVLATLPHLPSCVKRARLDPGSTPAAAALTRALASGSGAILASVHAGMWEALPGAVASLVLAGSGARLWVPVARVSNPILHKALGLYRTAAAPGTVFVPAPGSKPILARALERGHVVGLMLDAFGKVPSTHSPTTVSFLGRTLPARLGVFDLAAATGAPIFVAVMGASATEPVLYLEPATDPAPQAVYAAAERAIARTPHAYLWTHRLAARTLTR